MRISDWSSDLCSSDLLCIACGPDLWLRTDSTKARRFVMALARLGSAKKCSISSSSVDFPWVLHMVYAIHGRAPGSDVKSNCFKFNKKLTYKLIIAFKNLY